MRKRLYIAGIVLLLVLIGLGVWEGIRMKEPTYHGISLSAWVKNGSGGTNLQEAAREAGTNAIPTLLRLLRTPDSNVKVDFIDFLRKHGINKFYSTSPAEWHYRTAYAFSVLGTNAEAAAPELIRIADAKISPSSRACAIESLGYVGLPNKENVGALLRWGTNSDVTVRSWARAVLQRMDPETAKEAIETNLWRQ